MKSWSKLFLLALAVVLSAVPALADVPPIPMGDWQTATVGLGNSIQSVAVDPVNNRIFTANNLSGTVTVVNGKTNEVQTWTAGSEPKCLAVNPITGKLYVSINGSATNDTVVVFNTLGVIVSRLAVKSNPSSMLIDANNNRLYVANYGSDTISIFEGDILLREVAVKDRPRVMVFNPVMEFVYVAYENSDSVTVLTMAGTSNANIRSGLRAYDITVCASVNMAYVANADEDSVTVIDCNYNSISKKIKVGDYPAAIICDPAAKQAYAANMFDNTVTAINCDINTAVNTTQVQSFPYRMAVNPVTRKLYVGSDNGSHTVTVLDWRGTVGRDSLVFGHNTGNLVLNPVTNRIYVPMECGTVDSLAVIDGSDFDTTMVSAKTNTTSATVNPITGDAYFANYGSDNVTVIKANGDTLTIPVGDTPTASAVNPLTNKIFICNYGSKSVSVIDGGTYMVERTIEVDTLPRSVAVNPVTNYIYVTSFADGANRIKVIDGKDWDTTSVQVGLRPFSAAVNPATNRIYVTNYDGGNVSVIDGAHNTLIDSVPAGTSPYHIVVNPLTNKIFCANSGSSDITVINGATNTGTNVTVGNTPYCLAVNMANNKVYVSNYNSGTVTEIDGITDSTVTIPVLSLPHGIAADPVTGKVFVCARGSGRAVIIDCASRDTLSMPAGAAPFMVAVNPGNGKVYIADRSTTGWVTVIDQTVEQDTKVVSYDIMHIVSGAAYSYIATSGTTNFPGRAVNRWSPSKTKIQKSLFRLTTFGRDWHFADSYATGDSISWSLSLSSWASDSFIWGENILSYCAIDEQAVATNNLGVGTPFAGNNVSKPVFRLDYAGPTIAWWDSLADDNDSLDGYGPYTIRAVITDFSGVDNATLYYQMSGKSWPSVTMTRAAEDTFIVEIPAQIMTAGDTAVMSYFIGTSDHANSLNNNNNTISSSTRSFQLRNLTGVEGNPAETALPRTFALQPAYPNPSRGQAVIKYQLPKASTVQLQVYNVTGQLVKTINEGQKPAGYHRIDMNSAQLSNGIYFYRLRAGEYSATKKLVMLK